MKKRRPRAENTFSNPVAQALMNAKPLSAALVQDMQLREWSALESFATGKATESDARLVLDVHSLCLCGMDLGIGVEANDACTRAYGVVIAVFRQHAAGGPMRMDEAQLAVIRELQDLHDQQRALATMGEYKRMLQMAERMIEAKRAEVLSASRAGPGGEPTVRDGIPPPAAVSDRGGHPPRPADAAPQRS